MSGTAGQDQEPTVGPLDTVVVGLDGSKAAEAALRWVARRVPAEAVMHLVHGFNPATTLVAAAFQQDTSDHRDDIERLMLGPWATPAADAGWEHEPSVHVVDDDPADAIVTIADQVEADAIVVGAHGTSARHPHFIGGVTRKLLRHSTRPLVVVDPRAEQDSIGSDVRSAAKVLVCVGYGAPTNRAIGWAAAYADAAGRPLELLHAVSDRPLYPLDSPIDMLGSYLGPGVDLAWATEDLQETREELLHDWPDLTVTATVVQGSVVSSILSAARDADVVVVGKPHGAPFFRATISPRLYQLLARSTRSTVVVPSCDPAD